MVAERETAELAEQLIADSTAKEAIGWRLFLTQAGQHLTTQ
jgi:hypothetical protein